LQPRKIATQKDCNPDQSPAGRDFDKHTKREPVAKRYGNLIWRQIDEARKNGFGRVTASGSEGHLGNCGYLVILISRSGFEVGSLSHRPVFQLAQDQIYCLGNFRVHVAIGVLPRARGTPTTRLPKPRFFARAARFPQGLPLWKRTIKRYTTRKTELRLRGDEGHSPTEVSALEEQLQ